MTLWGIAAILVLWSFLALLVDQLLRRSSRRVVRVTRWGIAAILVLWSFLALLVDQLLR